MEGSIEGKTGTSVSLKHSTYKIIKEKRLNLSAEIEEWIERKYMDNQTILENLLKEKEAIEKRIEAMKQKIQEEKDKSQEEIASLSIGQINELKESIEILKNKGQSYLEGRHGRYNYMFNTKITLEKFRWLLENVK